MRSLFTLWIALLLPIAVWAQPNLNSADFDGPGNSLWYSVDSTPQPFVPTLGSGNLGSFTLPAQVNPKSVRIDILDAATARQNNNFPNATQAVQYEGDLTYFVRTATGLSEVGYVRRPNSRFVRDTSFVLTTPATYFAFPSTEGTSFRDTARFFFEAPASLLGFQTTTLFSRFESNRYLERESECPAYGSITLGGTTFNDVLIQRTTDRVADTIRIFNNLAGWIGGIPFAGIPEVQRDTIVNYFFIASGQRYFLAHIQTRRGSIVRSTYRDFVTTARPGLQTAEVTVYPNPASSTLNVRFTQQLASEATLSLVNALGQTVVVQPLAAQAQVVQVPLGSLSPGVYGYRIVGEGQPLVTGSVVVE